MISLTVDVLIIVCMLIGIILVMAHMKDVEERQEMQDLYDYCMKMHEYFNDRAENWDEAGTDSTWEDEDE